MILSRMKAFNIKITMAEKFSKCASVLLESNQTRLRQTFKLLWQFNLNLAVLAAVGCLIYNGRLCNKALYAFF